MNLIFTLDSSLCAETVLNPGIASGILTNPSYKLNYRTASCLIRLEFFLHGLWLGRYLQKGTNILICTNHTLRLSNAFTLLGMRHGY